MVQNISSLTIIVSYYLLIKIFGLHELKIYYEFWAVDIFRVFKHSNLESVKIFFYSFAT